MRALPVLLLCLGACAQFPALDGTISDAARAAPYPQLTPIPDFDETPVQADPATDARIAALQARAAALRRTDIAALQ